MYISKEILKHQEEFEKICIEHRVKLLFAFGSSITGSFNSNTSDIDLLVEIDESDPIQRGEKLISLWDTLESLFNRKVDLLTHSSIKNPYLLRRIEETKKLIYDGSGKKVLV